MQILCCRFGLNMWKMRIRHKKRFYYEFLTFFLNVHSEKRYYKGSYSYVFVIFLMLKKSDLPIFLDPDPTKKSDPDPPPCNSGNSGQMHCSGSNTNWRTPCIFQKITTGYPRSLVRYHRFYS